MICPGRDISWAWPAVAQVRRSRPPGGPGPAGAHQRSLLLSYRPCACRPWSCWTCRPDPCPLVHAARGRSATSRAQVHVRACVPWACYGVADSRSCGTFRWTLGCLPGRGLRWAGCRARACGSWACVRALGVRAGVSAGGRAGGPGRAGAGVGAQIVQVLPRARPSAASVRRGLTLLFRGHFSPTVVFSSIW